MKTKELSKEEQGELYGGIVLPSASVVASGTTINNDNIISGCACSYKDRRSVVINNHNTVIGCKCDCL